MTWTEFCSKKVYFIADLREIIHIEKQVLVAEERFKISNLPPEVSGIGGISQGENLRPLVFHATLYIVHSAVYIFLLVL